MTRNSASSMQWRVDLHVHTRRYSPCAELLDPEQLPAVMAERGLHGVVITEHDHLWSSEEIAELNQGLNGSRIFRGVEISSRNGHFLVIGMDAIGDLKPGVSAERILRAARDQNAAVIWAHPQLEYRQIVQPLESNKFPDGLHAVEVVSTATYGEQTEAAKAYARDLKCGMVGGSDAHVLDHVGKAFTAFNHLPRDEKELAAALCSGCYQAGHNGLPGDRMKR
ncbi:MAG: PHP domain-containing protein [Desulfobacteraceae bacterium]